MDEMRTNLARALADPSRDSVHPLCSRRSFPGSPHSRLIVVAPFRDFRASRICDALLGLNCPGIIKYDEERNVTRAVAGS